MKALPQLKAAETAADRATPEDCCSKEEYLNFLHFLRDVKIVSQINLH
jgi:hypothetical protein